MDLSSPPKADQVSLLTLPPSDLLAAAADGTACNPHHGDDNDIGSPPPPPLMLLQLPPKWSVSDLVQDAQFVISQQTPNQQATLVTTKKSFDVLKTETSNALVLIPPPTSSHNTTATSTNNKKRKAMTNDNGNQELTYLPARLLKPGGSGASFLELRERTLKIGSVKDALMKVVWDPYDDDKPPRGISVEELSQNLQFSHVEIRHALQRLALAFPLPDTHPTEYVWLDERPIIECHAAIIAALHEGGYDDYANTGILVDSFVPQVVDCMMDEEKFEHVEFVIKHCLEQLLRDKHKKRLSSNELWLDASKVSVFVARRLFQKQTEPWDEEALFAKWQMESPGVGDTYQIRPSMLRGVAIGLTDGKNGCKWKYLPAESLSSDPSSCFAALFDIKEKWSLDELGPYLEKLVDDSTGLSQAELFLRHTKQLDGGLYVKKE